jgi:hypothetical protein
MTTIDPPGQPTSLSVVTVESRIRALIAAALSLTLAGGAIIRSQTAPAERIFEIFAAAAIMAVARRFWGERLIASAEGITDRGPIRAKVYAWPTVRQFDVAPCQHLWPGYCIRLTTIDGKDHDLLSTRSYTISPSSTRLDELQRHCVTLRQIAAEHMRH